MSPLVVIGIAVLALVVLAAMDRFALAMLRPVHRPPGRTPDDVGAPAREWEVPEEPALQGWWMEGEDPDGPLVLLVHGWGANGAVLLPLVPALRHHASAVVSFDVRGHGRSDRAPMVSLRQFREDTLRAVRRLTQEDPGRRVVVVGHSMGGAAGILAAAQGAPVAGLVLIATPYDVYGAISRYLQERKLPGPLIVPFLRPFWRVRIGLPWRELHPGLALQRTSVPTLVIQPENDTRVPLDDGRRLAAASGSVVALVEGAAHSDILQHPRTGELIGEFLGTL